MLVEKDNAKSGSSLRPNQPVKIKATGQVGTTVEFKNGRWQVSLVTGGVTYVNESQIVPTEALFG